MRLPRTVRCSRTTRSSQTRRTIRPIIKSKKLLHAHATQLDTSCGPRQHLSCCLLVADQEAPLRLPPVRCSQTRRTVRPIIKLLHAHDSLTHRLLQNKAAVFELQFICLLQIKSSAFALAAVTVRCSQTRRTIRPTTKPNCMRMLLSLTHRLNQGST